MALSAAARLSAKYINERRLPDKAIDVMDEAGARVNLLPSNKRRMINETDIEAIVAKIARIPKKSVSMSDIEVLKNIDRKPQNGCLWSR